MSQLRVAHVIGTLRVGGAERQFVNLMNTMSAERKLAVFISRPATGPNLYSQLDPSIRQVRSLVRKRSMFRDILALRGLLREERINVVHTHMYWANLYGVVAARLAGIKVIVTSEHGENRWKKSVHRFLERHVISAWSTVRYCVSPRILSRRRDLDGVPEEKLRLLPNGTQMPGPLNDNLFGSRDVCIGSVGRIVTQKNFGMLVDVIDRLRQRGRPVKAVIVGDGPEMPSLRDAIEKKGLGDVVSLPGMDTDVSRWYRSFDIYACTSIEEGLPVTIIEAMSYGLPVISTDVGAIAEVVRDQIDGRVVPAGNPAEFAQALEGMLDDTGWAASLGRNGRRRAESSYSIEAVARTLENAYLECLDGLDTVAEANKSIG